MNQNTIRRSSIPQNQNQSMNDRIDFINFISKLESDFHFPNIFEDTFDDLFGLRNPFVSHHHFIIGDPFQHFHYHIQPISRPIARNVIYSEIPLTTPTRNVASRRHSRYYDDDEIEAVINRAITDLSIREYVPTKKPINKNVMKQFKQFVINARSQRLYNLERQNCVVCLSAFNSGEQAIRLTCEHVFHDSCITKWLSTSGICPVCRFDFTK